MTIISRTKAIMDAVMEEIRRTPGESIIEGGGAPVTVYQLPTETVTINGVTTTRETAGSQNIVQYAQDATGRCAMSHQWSEVTEDWIRAYCTNYPTPGDITFLESGLPADWQYPTMP